MWRSDSANVADNENRDVSLNSADREGSLGYAKPFDSKGAWPRKVHCEAFVAEYLSVSVNWSDPLNWHKKENSVVSVSCADLVNCLDNENLFKLRKISDFECSSQSEKRWDFEELLGFFSS